jgi:hypothetical protein
MNANKHVVVYIIHINVDIIYKSIINFFYDGYYMYMCF